MGLVTTDLVNRKCSQGPSEGTNKQAMGLITTDLVNSKCSQGPNEGTNKQAMGLITTDLVNSKCSQGPSEGTNKQAMGLTTTDLVNSKCSQGTQQPAPPCPPPFPPPPPTKKPHTIMSISFPLLCTMAILRAVGQKRRKAWTGFIYIVMCKQIYTLFRALVTDPGGDIACHICISSLLYHGLCKFMLRHAL